MSKDDFFSVLVRRRWTAASAFLLVFAVLLVLAFVLPKNYQATSYLLVSSPQQQNLSAYEQTQVSQALTETFSELLTTSAVSDAVRLRLPAFATVSDPSSAITLTTPATSVIIAITATARTPAIAQAIANTYASVFAKRSASFSADAGAEAQLVERATLPSSVSSPKKSLYGVAGVLLGVLAAIGAGLLRERLDTRVRVAPDAVELWGLPILARIPQLPVSAAKELRDYGSAHLPTLEIYRLLLANLRFVNDGERPSSIAVVSSSPQEGKSTTAISLARASAELDISTLLVDADLRRPEASRVFAGDGARQRAGLAQAIVDARPESAAQTLRESVFSIRGEVTLDLLPAGPPPPNPGVVLASSGLPLLAQAAADRYEFTVYDTPPLTAAADASHVASVVDGVVMVIDSHNAHRNSVIRALDQLRRSGANVLGIVLNRASEDALDGYGYGYGYGYTALADSAFQVDDTGTAVSGERTRPSDPA